jgi:hypothetical protein
MYTVRVDEPDPAFGNILLEQFGGANGDLDDRFHESCHKRGIHPSFQAPYICAWGF